MPGGFAWDFDIFQLGIHAEHLLSHSMGEFASQFEDARAVTHNKTSKIVVYAQPSWKTALDTEKYMTQQQYDHRILMKQMGKVLFTASQFAQCLALNESPAKIFKSKTFNLCTEKKNSSRIRNHT